VEQPTISYAFTIVNVLNAEILKKNVGKLKTTTGLLKNMA